MGMPRPDTRPSELGLHPSRRLQALLSFVTNKRCCVNVCFCNGPLCQAAPLCPARWLLGSVRGQLWSCHLVRSEEAASPIFPASSARQRQRTSRLHHLHPPSGGTTGLPRPGGPNLLGSPPHAIATASLVQRKLRESSRQDIRVDGKAAGKVRWFNGYLSGTDNHLKYFARSIRCTISVAA